jgi:hypothetical protein
MTSIPHDRYSRDDSGEIAAHGMGKGDVAHDSPPEEGADASFRAVEKLIGHQDIEGPVILFETAHSARGENPLHAKDLEPVDIRAEVQL